MIFRFTVTDPVAGYEHDVELLAEAESLVGSLLAALPVRAGGRPCYVGDELLDPERTLAESPLLAGARLSIGRPGPSTRDRSPGPAGVLRVVEGPDAGHAFPLAAGRHTIGRAGDSAVQLPHDTFVSRQHAVVSITPGGLSITDVNTSNGTLIAGVRAEGTHPVPEGARIQIGDDVLEYVPLRPGGLYVRRTGEGRLEFDRAFATAPLITRQPVDLPVAPPAGNGLRNVLLSAGAPVLLGGAMALLFHQLYLLAFTALAPLTTLVSYLSDRNGRKKRERDYEAKKAAAQQRISQLVQEEEQVRRQLAPDPTTILLCATGVAGGLWPRHQDQPDALVLRVGTADRDPAIEVRGEPWSGFEPPRLHAVPVTVDLRETGVLGVVGRSGSADRMAGWLLAQLATLRTPDDLRLVVLTPDGAPELAWTRWLPHLDTSDVGVPCAVGNTPATRAARLEELTSIIAARKEARREHGGETRFDLDVVVVLQGALALRKLPGMRELLHEGRTVGVCCICVDQRDMIECRGLVTLDGERVQVRGQRSERPQAAVADRFGDEDAIRVARALAPMRDRLTSSASSAVIPYPVRFLDLLDVTRPSADDVLARWAQRPGPHLDVPLGVDAQGEVTVDLARQGPHTMLAGATGAGKSILLQTLVTSLLLANRPDELNLVLVDFKGGSAFLPFEHCPHVVALIRNTEDDPAQRFDEAAAARVLASVRAEVRRRESILSRYGGEIDHYWAQRRDRPDLPALPRLVMVFDEYARAMDTSPDFPKELVAVAGKGRSLGMHLVFATQSLQGKLTVEMKNNISLRVTLRQNEKSDSVEVIGVPDAVTIPGRLRGRGMILCTLDEFRQPRLFQSGYLGDPPPAGTAAAARVRITDWPAIGLPRPQDRGGHTGVETDQELAIAAVREAAGRLGLPPFERPLLPPLPAGVRLDDLPARATVAAPPSGLPFGLADDPDDQQQFAMALDLAGLDRLMIAGGPQSGRTTAIRALIASLAGRFTPEQARFYVVSGRETELEDHERLPHCGGVVHGSEPDRLRRMVLWLGQEMQRRTRERFGVHRADPYLVLFVDGWELLESRGQGLFDDTSVAGILHDLISGGPPVGIHVVAAGGQPMLESRLPDYFTRRVVLRFPAESVRRNALGLGAATPPPSLPGRAVEAATGRHLQVADPGPGVPAQVLSGAGRSWPHRFPPLPTGFDPEHPDLWRSAPSPTWMALGVGGPELRPVGTDLFEVDPHLMLVSGPAGSGRSTAAALAVRGLVRVGVPVLVLAPPRSPLGAMVGHLDGVRLVSRTTTPDAELRAAAADLESGRYAVVLDDCEQLKVTASIENFAPAPTLLDDIADPGSAGRRALVLCGDAAPVLDGAARSMARVVEATLMNGTCIGLSPQSLFAAKQLGLLLERDQILPMPPGRGYLKSGRQSLVVQLGDATRAGQDSPVQPVRIADA